MAEDRGAATARGSGVRQRDIARRAGVSASTVSRVLNDLPGISSGLRQQVRAAAADLGFQDGQLRRRRLSHVALFAAAPHRGIAHDAFYGDILGGVEAECRRYDIHLSFAIVESGAGPAFVRERVGRNGIDGLLFLAIDDARVLTAALALGVPTAVINAEHPDLPIDTLLPDNEAGPRRAVRHLVDRGHRRILHATATERATLRRRHNAVRAAIAETGAVDDPALIVEVPMAIEGAHATMQRLLAAPPDFTAVVCVHDLAAVGVMRALLEAGRRIPEDVSVVGFNDLPLTGHLMPPLTTVRIAREELGILAVRRLLDRAEDPTLTPVRIDLATSLVERGSVAPPPAQSGA